MKYHSAPSILVVDEDKDVFSTIHSVAGNDHLVINAKSLDEAFDILNRNNICIMLCNENMGTENSLLFMSKTRDKFHLLQLILMSEGIDEDLFTFAINDVGVLKYLKKPFAIDQIKHAIDTAYSHYLKAVEIEAHEDQYKKMIKKMHGIPYHARRVRLITGMLTRNSQQFLLASVTAIIALQGLFLGLGAVVLCILYLMKSIMGINVFAELHLQDLL